MDYSYISKELTNKLSKIEKKNNGIYFTPPSCVSTNIKLLQPYIKNIVNVIRTIVWFWRIYYIII